MKVEIERKFLLASDGWRREVQRSEYIRDGLIAISDERKTRVRIIGESATLTVKTKRTADSRYEFEYDIPLEDGELLLASCGSNATAKHRHYVLHEGLTWEIDEYDGILKGVVLAEVELEAIDQLIDMPSWIGREVTAQAPYRKINMLRDRQKDLNNPTSEA
jgi:adenylate cyclase